jgi:uncharacterized damage-inducible protein DinB
LIADHFRTVFAHSYWAWNRVLDQVAQISQDDYTAPRMLDHESIRTTMMHAMGAEIRYLTVWKGEPAPERLDPQTTSTADAMRSIWVDQQKKTESFLATLTDADCARQIKQISRDGQETVTPLNVLMAQALNHHAQHRAEIALHITQLGHSPGDLDVTRYYRDRK